MVKDNEFALECIKRLVPDTSWYGDSNLDSKSEQGVNLISDMLEIILKELTTDCLANDQYNGYASFKSIHEQKQQVTKWVMEYLSDYSLDYDIVKKTRKEINEQN